MSDWQESWDKMEEDVRRERDIGEAVVRNKRTTEKEPCEMCDGAGRLYVIPFDKGVLTDAKGDGLLRHQVLDSNLKGIQFVVPANHLLEEEHCDACLGTGVQP